MHLNGVFGVAALALFATDCLLASLGEPCEGVPFLPERGECPPQLNNFRNQSQRIASQRILELFARKQYGGNRQHVASDYPRGSRLTILTAISVENAQRFLIPAQSQPDPSGDFQTPA